MKYVEAPNRLWYSGRTSVFLAGGISNCPNWQHELANKLRDTELFLINPRRHNFPMGDQVEGEKQIKWEHNYLRRANVVSFWFPEETLCPITLFELGAVSATDKPLFVGCHPNYKRKFDIEIQLELRRPEVEIVYDIESLAKQLRCLG